MKQRQSYKDYAPEYEIIDEQVLEHRKGSIRDKGEVVIEVETEPSEKRNK